MNVNEVPSGGQAASTTGCCAPFDPANWEGAVLHFDRKRFAKTTTWSLFHVPINMRRVFSRTLKSIREADAGTEPIFVMSRELSAWRAEHLFAVEAAVPALETVELSGDFVTRTFEGPYANEPNWLEELARDVRSQGRTVREMYVYYTTCPRCAKAYGKNYVVGIARVE